MGRCVLTSGLGKFKSGYCYGTVMELKFNDGASRTFFSLGILNDKACVVNVRSGQTRAINWPEMTQLLVIQPL